MFLSLKAVNKNCFLFLWLQEVFGLNMTKSKEVCLFFNYNMCTKVKDLNSFDVLEIKKYIQATYKFDNVVQREFFLNIAHLKKIKCYRGLRHYQHLPVRGQRTHTNAQTQKKKYKKDRNKKKI